MSAESQRRRDQRWSRTELVGLIALVWMLAVLFYLVLVIAP